MGIIRGAKEASKGRKKEGVNKASKFIPCSLCIKRKAKIKIKTQAGKFRVCKDCYNILTSKK